MSNPLDTAISNTLEITTLGGGCFWCLEAVYSELKGVTRVVSGYSGGAQANPSYREVCSGTTGHAEVVQITFDPDIVSFRDLLTIFFTIHDPTTPNRQGADVGPQYRSIIFYHNDRQHEMAADTIAEFSAAGLWRDPIVTEITPFQAFYPAEDYHQDYYQNNSSQAYCRIVIDPKLAKLRSRFSSMLK